MARESSGEPLSERIERFQDMRADNPMQRSVLDALATGEHPERLSPLIPSSPFDQAEFEADPKAYLNVVEPARCFQTAQAVKNKESIYLDAVSPPTPRGAPGETTTLMVKGTPRAPVTFTAFEGGTFVEDGLNSVSVRADVRGYASAHFRAPKEARGTMAVLAGSPLAIGRQLFLVDAAPTVAAD